MKQLLARLGAGPGVDHRAVFAAFARGLRGTITRPRGGERDSHGARVRVVRG
jgi:hypothetical protein